MPLTDLPRARRHEALALRLESLLKQLSATAARRPDMAVPEEIQNLAETLLREADGFLHPGRRLSHAKGTRPIPQFSTLCVTLGQGMAALETWELTHSAWSTERKCFVWLLEKGEDEPVRRHRPQTDSPKEKAKVSNHYRELLVERLFNDRRGRAREGYERGWEDAKADRPRVLSFD